ncbi:MAG: hypothetical protein ACK4YU_12265 [Paracoccus sp. (in: a-proteobacteria)]
MKMSDMFAMLADNARAFEQRMGSWQEEMSKNGENAMEQARKWQETAKERQEEVNSQIRAHMETANEQVRSQWQKMQSGWEEQFEKMRAQGEEMRAAAMKMSGGKDGQGFADWTEAYAAQMVSFAQKMQGEAAEAITRATEARAGKTTTKKS